MGKEMLLSKNLTVGGNLKTTQFGVIPLDLCFIVSNSNIETTNLGIMGNQKCHVPTLKYILYYTPTHKGLHEPENKRA